MEQRQSKRAQGLRLRDTETGCGALLFYAAAANYLGKSQELLYIGYTPTSAKS